MRLTAEHGIEHPCGEPLGGPALGAVYAGQSVKQRLTLAMLARFGGVGGLSAAGRDEVEGWARSQPRCGARGLAFVGSALDAVGSQGVVTTSSPFYDELLRIEAASLRSALDAREAVGARVDELLGRIPDAQAPLSMPGVGRVTAATFVSEVPNVSLFASAARLAAYAGLAPRVRQSGRSLNSVTKPRAGNRRLKRALVLSAARSVDFCEESRAYYDRKRSGGEVPLLRRRACPPPHQRDVRDAARREALREQARLARLPLPDSHQTPHR
ncbi:MAG: IS110 family transposase [Atopobiaceae bacterium]|nr:IS110 family transposase [Atopobiaceae bacterium]